MKCSVQSVGAVTVAVAGLGFAITGTLSVGLGVAGGLGLVAVVVPVMVDYCDTAKILKERALKSDALKKSRKSLKAYVRTLAQTNLNHIEIRNVIMCNNVLKSVQESKKKAKFARNAGMTTFVAVAGFDASVATLGIATPVGTIIGLGARG